RKMSPASGAARWTRSRPGDAPPDRRGQGAVPAGPGPRTGRGRRRPVPRSAATPRPAATRGPGPIPGTWAIMATILKITQKRSTIGGRPATRRTMRALGLKKIGESVTHEDSPTLQGMIRTVQHLIEVTTTTGD